MHQFPLAVTRSVQMMIMTRMMMMMLMVFVFHRLSVRRSSMNTFQRFFSSACSSLVVSEGMAEEAAVAALVAGRPRRRRVSWTGLLGWARQEW